MEPQGRVLIFCELCGKRKDVAVIYRHLFDRVQEPATVRAGLIGVGQFGTPIVSQAPGIPRLEVPVVADVDV